MTRRAVAVIVAALGLGLAALGFGLAALAGVASADAPGTTTTRLIEPGTTPGTDDTQTHGTLTPRPRPTVAPEPPMTPLTVQPQYTG
jgi:hypothetical protein